MNVINIAKGLLDRHEQIKDSDPETAAQIRGDLELMADEVRTAVSELRGLVDPPTIELPDKSVVPTTGAEDIRTVGRRLDELLGARAKRTAAAPKAPEKA